MEKVKVAVIGPGNIGSDLMYKIFRSQYMEMALMTGIVESEGIRRARDLGVDVSTDGVNAVISRDDIRIVFEATSAAAHLANAPLLKEAGKISIDLTPAAVGPYCVPSVNLDKLQKEQDINMVTCGGQATIPIIHAIERVAGAKYAEIVACISSKSAGPGTRANMDEFTETTTRAIIQVGGADRGKAIIVLNPAEPPFMMTNTVMVRIKDKKVNFEVIEKSVQQMVTEMLKYVPGYRLRVPPVLDGDKVTTVIEIEGQGDFLPVYSGNLDIINAAAVAAGDRIAARLVKGVE